MRFALIFVVPVILSAYNANPAYAFSDGISDADVNLSLGRQLLDRCATTNDPRDCQKLLEFNEGFSTWEGSTSSYPDVLFLNPANTQSSVSK